MSEPAKAHLSESHDDFTEEADLPTNRLHSGQLEARPPLYIISNRAKLDEEPQPVDWVATLTTQNISLGQAPDELQGAELRPSGMSQHATAPRMAPTVGARMSSGLRRTTLMAILGVFAVGILVAGGYVLATTPWISTLVGSQSQPAAPSTNAGSKPQVQPPVQAPQAPIEEQPSDRGTATELRDRGLEQYKSGNFNEAIGLLESSVAKSGDDAITQYQLGLAYLAVQGREHSLEDAEMAFRTASALQPTWAAPYQAMSESLLRRGFYKQAIEPALQATRLDPSLVEAWMTLGRAYQGAGMKAEATAAFVQASRSAPAPPVQP